MKPYRVSLEHWCSGVALEMNYLRNRIVCMCI